MHLARRNKDKSARLDRIAFIISDECAGSRLDPGHMIKIVAMRDVAKRDALGQFLQRNTESIIYLSSAAGQAEQWNL